jgi:hypothetical protein
MGKIGDETKISAIQIKQNASPPATPNVGFGRLYSQISDKTLHWIDSDGNDKNLSAGGGNVVGPVSAIIDNITTFTDVTGEAIKDSGVEIANVAYPLGVGYLEGLQITINANPNLIDITAGTVVFTDASLNPLNPTFNTVIFAGVVGHDPAFRLTSNATFLAINLNGDLVESATDFTVEQLYDNVRFSVIAHTSNTIVEEIEFKPLNIIYNLAQRLTNVGLAIGITITSGNRLEGIAATRTFRKTSGTSFGLGINAQASLQITDNTVDALANPATFFYSFFDGVDFIFLGAETEIDDTNFNDITSGIVAMDPNTYRNDALLFSPSSQAILIILGQTTYNSLQAALDGISEETPMIDPGFTGNTTQLGFITVKKGFTDLTNVSDAKITNVSKFGTSGGGGGSPPQNLQETYNGSTQPQIVTTALLGAVQMKDGLTANSVLEILDNTDNVSMAIASSGFTHLELANSEEVTISGGAITVTQTFHRVDTSGPATENLDTINFLGSPTDGQILVIRPQDAGRTIVVRHGFGNIQIHGSTNITLDEQYSALILVHNDLNNVWMVPNWAFLDINGLTADASPIGSTDFVATYDASAGVNKKVLLDDLPGGVNSGAYSSIAILKDIKATGVDGGSSAAGTWNPRDLNTEHFDPDSIVTIASNEFTPISGDYEISSASAAFETNQNRARVFNVTGASIVAEGVVAAASSASSGASIAPVLATFTANGTDAYRIDHYTVSAKTNNGLGLAVGDGAPEVYLEIILRKLA